MSIGSPPPGRSAASWILRELRVRPADQGPTASTARRRHSRSRAQPPRATLHVRGPSRAPRPLGSAARSDGAHRPGSGPTTRECGAAGSERSAGGLRWASRLGSLRRGTPADRLDLLRCALRVLLRWLGLRAEDHEGAKREHAEKREDRRRHRRPAARGVPPEHRDRRGQSDDDHEPEDDPHAKHFADRAGDREGDEEKTMRMSRGSRNSIRRLQPNRGVGIDVAARASE